MTHCTQCGNELSANDHFCGNCGAPRNGQGRRREQQPSRDSRPARREPVPFTPALQTEEGRAGALAVITAKKAQARSLRRAALVIAAVLSGLAAVLWSTGIAVYFGIPAGVALFVALVAGPSAWSEAEYYSVPGSRDASGEHRCIHCGHRGIYRHGQYKSNTKYADCSKCKTTLWHE